MKKGLIWLLLVPLILLVFFALSPTFASWAGIPSQIRVFPGSEYSLYIHLPFRLTDKNGADVTGPKRLFSLISDEIGSHEFQVKLFGIFPVKEMIVDVVPQVQVYPGGHSIGVLLNEQGLMVSQVVSVRGIDGREYKPAIEAGIKEGDILLSIAGHSVRKPEQVSAIVNMVAEPGKPVEIIIERAGRQMKFDITPILSLREDIYENRYQAYMLGLIIEDPAAGVGTLSFYDPATGRYGALGHTITDSNGRDLQINNGTIVEASIDSIKQGYRGVPGEKLGTFQNESDILGNVDKNTTFGIYGILNRIPKHPFFKEPIPVALAHQVKTGPAEIYTVIQGNRIEKFEIEIIKVANQRAPSDKGLVIEVVDKRLLNTTGGIVQGMSGSPIVQNGMLVGAVTHVFVNDPTRGYGNLIEWMVYEAGLTSEAALNESLERLRIAV